MDNKKLINLLSLFSVFLVIPLMLGTFFDGYSIISKGVQTNAPVEVSLFGYLEQNSALLKLSFVFALILVFAIIVNIIYTVKLTMDKQQGGITRLIFAIIIMVSAFLMFLFTIIYCKNNTQIDGSASLTYKVGGTTILMLVCGLVIGALNLTCYFLSLKKKKVKK